MWDGPELGSCGAQASDREEMGESHFHNRVTILWMERESRSVRHWPNVLLIQGSFLEKVFSTCSVYIEKRDQEDKGAETQIEDEDLS